MRKKLIASLLTALLIAGVTPAGASAEWKQDSNGKWFTYGNSCYTGWHAIDGNFYYFNANGYMVTNSSIEGMTLGNDGKCQITNNGNTAKISATTTNNINKSEAKIMPYCFDDSAVFTDGYLYNNNGKSFTMAGIQYTEGFTLTGTSSALFNLGGKYNNIKFKAGPVYSKYIVDATVTIYLDGKENMQMDLKHSDLPKEITIPVNKANQMKIRITKNKEISEYGFIDMIGY